MLLQCSLASNQDTVALGKLETKILLWENVVIDQPVIASGKWDDLVFNSCCIYSACEQKAKEEEETHCVLLNLIYSLLFSLSLPFKVLNNASSVVVITFSKADAERLRLFERELRLTSDYYKSD